MPKAARERVASPRAGTALARAIRLCLPDHRHSGAERSEEPGIHNPCAGVMDSGLAAVAAIRNDAFVGWAERSEAHG
jgi:hypothetical protein